MAEGVMRSKIEKYNLDAVVDSCGTANYHVGDSPDRRAQLTLKNKHTDISQLRGRQFSISDFDEFDVIYTMDEENYMDILALARNEEDKNKVDMIMNKLYPKENISVPDPYYGGQQDFEDTFTMLDLVCEKISDELK
jgi:protein-tyrosine phosphatase